MADARIIIIIIKNLERQGRGNHHIWLDVFSLDEH